MEHQEIAKKFRVTPKLVRDLVVDAKRRQSKKYEEKTKRKEQEKKRIAVVRIATDILERGNTIQNSKEILDGLQSQYGLRSNPNNVRKILKKDLKLSYVKAKKVHPLANSDRVLVQRQQCALVLLEQLK